MEGQSGLSELSVISWVSAIQGCPLSGLHCNVKKTHATNNLRMDFWIALVLPSYYIEIRRHELFLYGPVVLINTYSKSLSKELTYYRLLLLVCTCALLSAFCLGVVCMLSLRNTVDREIFVVKKFLPITSTTKIKAAKYFLRRIIRVTRVRMCQWV